MIVSLLAQGVEQLGGSAGWVGAGMLGAVLGWLMFVYLPAKDKQITALLNLFIEATNRRDDRMDVQRKELMADMRAIVEVLGRQRQS